MQSSQIPIPSKVPTTCGKSPRCGAPRRFCPPTYLNHMEVISTIKHKRCVGIEWYSILSWYIIHLLYHVTYTYNMVSTWYPWFADTNLSNNLAHQISASLAPVCLAELYDVHWNAHNPFVFCSIASVLDGTNFICMAERKPGIIQSWNFHWHPVIRTRQSTTLS